MHTTAIGTNNVPAFLIKLWKLVEDSKCDDLICWNSTGTTFLIRDQTRFSKELLPLYFKHNNMASFIRQLNMYGFRKVVSVEQGGLRMEKDEIEFQHMYFLKGHEYLLELIKRKAAISKTTEEVNIQPEIVSKMIFDVKNLHGKQENLDTKLSAMKRENETLWREIATLRQQHMKQQQIVNKLIQFLLTLVQPNRSLGVKRKLPLMLNDSSHSDTKLPRVTRAFSLDSDKGSEIQLAKNVVIADTFRSSRASTSWQEKLYYPVKSAAGVFSGVKSSGPVIHDITDVVDADAFLKNEKLLSIEEACPSPVAVVHPVVDSPVASTSVDGLQSTELSPATQMESMVATKVSNNLESESLGDPSSPTNPEKLDEFFRELNSGNSDYLESNLTGNSNAEPMLDFLEPDNDNSKIMSKLDFSDYIDNMQVELESLKDILSNSGCTIDTSTLMGLFSDDLLSSKGLSDLGEIGKDPRNEIVGTELMQYNPSVLDFQDHNSVSLSTGLPSESMDELLFDYVGNVMGETLEGTEADNAELPATSASLTDINETVPTTDLALMADPEFLVDPPNLLVEVAMPLSPEKSDDRTKDAL